MSRDLNDTRQNRRLEQLAKFRDAGDDDALAAVMRTADGRRVLSRLARDFGWMGETWDATSARQTDFNAGLQSALISVFQFAVIRSVTGCDGAQLSVSDASAIWTPVRLTLPSFVAVSV